MSNDVSSQILVKEQQRGDALLAGDADALAALLSDDLVFAHANATFETKDTLVKKMAAGTIVYKELSITETRVMDFGDTALLFSRLTAAVTVGGSPRSIDNYTLSAWHKEGDDWKLVAYQPTAIPQ